MPDRRTFLWQAGGALALGSLGLSGLACASRETPPEAAPAALDEIGVQLYTVRELMAEDVEGTLEQVAAIGYDVVETAGLYGLTPEELRALLDEYGLRSPAGHYGLEMLRDDFEGVLETAKALGQTYVVCPFLSEEARASRDDYRARAEEFNRFGVRCQEAGLRFAYHNHDFEFETLGGEGPAFDLLLEGTDPELVDFEMDLYWTYKANHDPLDYFERYPGRFTLFHVKDGTAAPEKEMVDVGEGAMDFEGIFARTEEAGLEYAFVEHDQPEDPLQSIRTSYQHLEQLAL